MSNDKPVTLRTLAGASAWQTPQRGKAAVVIIDAQEVYGSGALPLTGLDDALTQIERLRERATEMDWPVIHVAHQGPAGSPFDPAGGGAFLQRAQPAEGEAVVTKPRPNAFSGTDLEQHLRDVEGPVLVVGFMTHMCVSSTVRAGYDLGFDMAVVAAACATRDLPATDDTGVVSAEQLHKAALAAMSDVFVLVLATVEEV
ncbi:Isochorismatase hydrolase [Alloalcanivorax dieselolei B5]|uniref:Isochorismatase hydrolase n=1 Tax=Alcanivorax dieselolei (strain DSM 16502 / CGMCC 1.3690 / MCCC 1A00001 / B-5) TaxID=930169 RepID=K0CIY1_ALCDB|nr:cysteine hydrolase family protein [Alloalcanivorax dieselolei]AFT72603.1 Isochorismatase hydrolase [Alloalcanivorax dieselolei B5]GGJ79099.1 cysteine hydrolase [Alloalcanivorax dieselolei]